MSEYIVKCKEFVGISGKTVKFPEYIDLNQEIVRCRDCDSASFDEFGGGWCIENCREIKAWYFCAWGARREP